MSQKGSPETGPGQTLRVFLVAGEHSGDQLGFKLMRALRERAGQPVAFIGVGGDRMEAEGLRSLFPLSDIAVMGILPVVQKLPGLLRRIKETVRAVLASQADILVIIDSPDFTHRVARLVRRQRPDMPVVDYVSPSVWAWRTGRAKAMRAYVDHVLALLPFEPDAHRRLNGPACSYVGHPLIERMDELRPSSADEQRRAATPPSLVVLPGSRRSEIRRLMHDFGQALGVLHKQAGPFEVVLPAVEHLEAEIRQRAASWPVVPRIVLGEAAKLQAFRQARLALAASGTVTLELALAGVPMVVGYRVSALEMQLRFLIKVPSIVLPNLIVGQQVIPEFIGKDCTPDILAEALQALLRDGPERQRQEAMFAKLREAMLLPGGEEPSGRAAAIILDQLRSRPVPQAWS